jgi:uncharacterized protein
VPHRAPTTAGAPRARGPVGYQQWRDLLFLHWPMPAEAVRPLVPAGLDLDLLEGRAYVTLMIPFAIPESRPVGVPPMLGTRFLETNLCTYVRGRGRGTRNLLLLAGGILARRRGRGAAALRVAYFLARMSMRKAGTRVT